MVTIIVPCYNQAQYLPDALQSVLNQTYTNWECIIVNDGSPDNSEEVAQQWCKKDARFSYYFQKNVGVSAARNFGIKIAKGDYIQFLDGDDILEKDKIYNQVHFLEKEKKVDIVYSSNRYFFSEDKANLFAIHYTGILPTVDISMDDTNQKDVLSMRNVCTICSSLYRRKIFDTIQFKKIIYEDWFFHVECSLNNFIFHFENFENSMCLIRMTNESQLIKHNSQQSASNNFNVEFENLVKKFNFNSKLVAVRNAIQTNVKPEDSESNKYRIKYFIVSLIPPIVFQLKNKFFKR